MTNLRNTIFDFFSRTQQMPFYSMQHYKQCTLRIFCMQRGILLFSKAFGNYFLHFLYILQMLSKIVILSRQCKNTQKHKKQKNTKKATMYTLYMYTIQKKMNLEIN